MFRIAFLALLLATHAAAQEWPAKPVRIVVPFSAGGFADNSVRAISERLSARLGQPVVIENKAGASGNIGAELVAKSAPDGYTLLAGFDGTIVINPHVFAKTGFDSLRDFAPVTKLGEGGMIVVAHPSVAAANLRELIALAKAKPGTLSYGSSGTGGTAHLACELLCQQAGIDMQHIPYKGGSQAITDVVGGQIPLVCTAVATAHGFLKSGKLKGLGISSALRTPAAPDVPTFVESGLAGLVVNSWMGILAPAKTPAPIVARLQKDIAAVLQLPDVRERYAVLGIEPVGNAPEQYAAEIRADFARWGAVVKKANVRVE